ELGGAGDLDLLFLPIEVDDTALARDRDPRIDHGGEAVGVDPARLERGDGPAAESHLRLNSIVGIDPAPAQDSLDPHGVGLYGNVIEIPGNEIDIVRVEKPGTGRLRCPGDQPGWD